MPLLCRLSYRGIAGDQGLEPRTGGTKGRCHAIRPVPMEPPPSATLGCRPYKDRLVAGPRGIVCEAGFEPATSRLSTWRLYRLGYKHLEPPTRLERVACSLRGSRSAR